MTITKDFESYSLRYLSRKTPTSNSYATISCFSSGLASGFIFFSDYSPLDDNRYENNKIYLFFDISRFNDIISILRYEKPLQICFNEAKKEGWIQIKSSEPVGEQE